MADIRHKLVIKVNPEKVYKAITTQEGIESWWCKQTTAKPEIGFTNVFVFAQNRIEMKVTELSSNKKVAWQSIGAVEEWLGTTVTFELEEKEGNTILRFAHAGWKEVTDTFAMCNFDWAIFLKSLKSYCETGTGEPR
jgi:uncharacterized protein YndB with AHSA1/START domain